ncbi:MAG: site-specific integrase [Gammaproteobacteria bacterium]|nr:site-specific integrase [Gammaproteobacteria bacterium]
MAEETHSLMDGKLRLYRRENSRYWQCSTYLSRRNYRTSTKEESLVRAKEFARDWFIERYAEELRRRKGKPLFDALDAALQLDHLKDHRKREIPTGPTFDEAADAFIAEAKVVTEGERHPYYVTQKEQHLRLHLRPFFGQKAVTQIDAGQIQAYRVHRIATNVDRQTKEAKRPSRSTLHQEIVTLRQVLKTANRKGWLAALPDMSAPYKKSGKITHRAWFSPEDYKRLFEASRDRAAKPKKERWRKASENLHDYILFMVNTGLRPDEALRIEYRDVKVVLDDDTNKQILEIEVRGKRGVGFCKSMPGAVIPFQRLQKRSGAAPTAKVFPRFQKQLFNDLLTELDLRTDREGQHRTAYSLRHTYICLRLMEGADIYQVAKNCRTSVEMIEKFYASHIKNTLDASAINVTKPKRRRKKTAAKSNDRPGKAKD